MQRFMHDEDRHVLDIIGNRPIKEFYDYINAESRIHKELAHGLDYWLFTRMQAEICLGLYYFAAYIQEGDSDAEGNGT